MIPRRQVTEGAAERAMAELVRHLTAAASDLEDAWAEYGGRSYVADGIMDLREKLAPCLESARELAAYMREDRG